MNHLKKAQSPELQAAIDEYLADGGKVKKVQPAAAKGNEMRRDTRELVARKRAEFRRAQK